jgi:hypothetical protein
MPSSDMTGHLIIVLVLGLLLAARSKKPRQAGRLKILAYPWTFKLFCIIALSMIGFSFWYIWTEDPEGKLALSVIMIPVGFAVIAVSIEFFGVSISFDDHSIHKNSPWSSARSMPWAQIIVVQDCHWRSCYLLLAENSGKISVNKHLNGTEKLLQFVRTKLDSNNHDKFPA